MRTLAAQLQTDVNKKITDPVYVVEIKFASWMYLSSREQLTLTTESGSHTFLPDRILSVKPMGTSATLSLENGDRSISAAALAGQIKGNSCIIYLSYGTNVTKIFSGEIISLEMSDDNRGARVDFELQSASVLEARWPTERIGKNLGCNHLPAPGLSFIYGTSRYTLQAMK